MSQFRIPFAPFSATRRLSAALPLSAAVLATALTGCGREEVKYEPVPEVTGISVNLPPVPNVQLKPVKDGDAYTVWGASYYQRNRVHTKEVSDKEITVTGHIVKTNLMDAPECAVHKTGEADPEDCKAPVPTFWIADDKGAELKDAMKVMGWASNFAQIHDAIEEIDKEGEEAEYSDSVWGVDLPNPLPAKGAKVKVSGTYSTVFNMASGGIESDPIMGIITYKDMEYLKPPPEKATLPGVERKEK